MATRRTTRTLATLARDGVYVVQHKPFSFLSPSTAPRGNKRFAVDLLTRSNGKAQVDQRTRQEPCSLEALRCAGRLDADATGLMLWSTDRRWVERIIGPSSAVEKEYLVRVTGHEGLSDAQFAKAVGHLRHGIYLDGEPLQPAGVRWLNEAQLQLTLVEGRHRQIRRTPGLQAAHPCRTHRRATAGFSEA